MDTVAVSGVNLSLAVELLEGNYDMLEIRSQRVLPVIR